MTPAFTSTEVRGSDFTASISPPGSQSECYGFGAFTVESIPLISQLYPKREGPSYLPSEVIVTLQPPHTSTARTRGSK